MGKSKVYLTSQRARQFFAAPFVVFLLVFVVLPLVLLFANALFEDGKFTFRFFTEFFTDEYSLTVLGRSLWVAFVAALICLAIAYPIAYILAFSNIKRAGIYILLFIMPMWINTLLRTFALKEFLYLFTENFGYGTMLIGIVMDYLPFMILPIYTVLSNIDKKYIEASRDLGAPPRKVFMKTVLPLSVPGIISGFLIVFTPTVSTYFISEYLGNSNTMMFGELLNSLWRNNFGKASVLALILLVIVLASVLITNRLTKIGNKRGGLW